MRQRFRNNLRTNPSRITHRYRYHWQRFLVLVPRAIHD
jgi:hypothetical protein